MESLLFLFSQEVTETLHFYLRDQGLVKKTRNIIYFNSCNSRFSDSHSAGSYFLLDCQKRCFEVLKSPNNYINSKNRHDHDSDILQAFDMQGELIVDQLTGCFSVICSFDQKESKVVHQVFMKTNLCHQCLNRDYIV